MTDRSERNLTEVLEAVAQAYHARIMAMATAEGQPDRDEPIPSWEELAPYAKHVMKDQLLPVVMDVLNIVDAEPHKAKRGDDVEAWVKANRDFWGNGEDSDGPFVATVLNDMLDDYRAHADYGRSLRETIQEPPEPEAFFEAALSATRDASEVLGPLDLDSLPDVPSKQMREYIHNPERGASGPYEADAKYQFVDQTDVWAVHFNCPRDVLQDVLERMSRLLSPTGEYLYEEAGTLSDHDAEPTDEDHRLVIYYTARRDRAFDEGWHLVAHAHFASKSRTSIDLYVSTAGDHSAQIEEHH